MKIKYHLSLLSCLIPLVLSANYSSPLVSVGDYASVFFDGSSSLLWHSNIFFDDDKEVEELILKEYAKPRFAMDDSGQLKKQIRNAPQLHTRSDGSTFLAESELDCETLPLSIRMNRRALPFHCRCPDHIEILPPD